MMVKKGFTIVELLIVIVVIGVLAAISIVAYNGIQTRANTEKINSDLSLFHKAARSARIANGDQVLQTVTTSYNTSGTCMGLASGTELSDKTAAAGCWTSYTNALNAISTTSGIDIRGLVDPWGRPYFLDENEREGGAACGGRDNFGVFARPHQQSVYGAITNSKPLPFITPGC